MTEQQHTAESDAPRTCWCCDHIHNPASPGQCYEAACHPSCPEDHGDGGPYTYDPDTTRVIPPASTEERDRQQPWHPASRGWVG